MRITAIQHGTTCYPSKQIKTRHNSQPIATTTPEIGQDVVNFKSHEIIKGASAGALLGLAALSVISGGAATPIAYAVYAATMGTAGGMLGKAVKGTNNDEKK